VKADKAFATPVEDWAAAVRPIPFTSEKEAFMARLPFDPATLSPSDLAIYNRMVERRNAQGAGFGGPYRALMNHPQLCEKIEDLGYFLKFQAAFP